MILTAAITAALGESLTVYGVGKKISFTTSKDEKTGTLIYTIESDAPVNKIQEIRVTPKYLPARYIESTNSPGKNHLNNDWNQGGITICSGFNSEEKINTINSSTEVRPDIISTDRLFNIGQEMNNFKGSLEGLSYTVKSIEVMDKLPELNTEGFIDYQLYLDSINESGNLKPYERIINKYWDNNKMNTESETMTMKFVYVTLDLTNPLETDIIDKYFCPIVVYMNNSGDDTLQFIPTVINNSHSLQCENAPMYCDKLDYPGRHSRFINVLANTTEKLTLIFAIDEDRLDNAYIGFNRIESTDEITPDYKPTYIKKLNNLKF